MKMKVSGKINELSSCSIRYLELRTYHSARPDWCPSVASSSFLSQRLNASKNLYSKDLYAHYGCVNAIEFSNEGDLLVSGKYIFPLAIIVLYDRKLLILAITKHLMSSSLTNLTSSLL